MIQLQIQVRKIQKCSYCLVTSHLRIGEYHKPSAVILTPDQKPSVANGSPINPVWFTDDYPSANCDIAITRLAGDYEIEAAILSFAK